MKHVTISAVALFAAFYSDVIFSGNQPGFVIEDKEAYPLYQYSQLTKHNELPSILLKGGQSDNYSTVVKMLDSIGMPYLVVSESPAIFQTDWISWHYDAESNKTLSVEKNRFFSLNLRDRYKFKISIRNNKFPEITLDNVAREQEVDITSGTEMVWLKWKPIDPDTNAVNAFMQRLQTEYELQALASNIRVTHKVKSNQILLMMSVDQAWGNLIQHLKKKSVPLENAHNDQRMLNTGWLNAEYDHEAGSFNLTSSSSQRHQFQLLVIPGSTENTSSIFVYHTAYQQNSGSSSWSDKSTQESIAGAFLGFLKLDQ